MSKAIILCMDMKDAYDLSIGYSDFVFPLQHVGRRGKKLKVKRAIKAYIYLGTHFSLEQFNCTDWYTAHAYEIVGHCVLQEVLPYSDGKQVFRLRDFQFFPESDMLRLLDVRRPRTIADKIFRSSPQMPQPNPWDWVEEE